MSNSSKGTLVDTCGVQVIRVMVVDDSPIKRRVVAAPIARAPEFEVVATAHNANNAWAQIQSEGPDVTTLDVGIPDMDGLIFLVGLMPLRPIPLVSGRRSSKFRIPLADPPKETTIRACTSAPHLIF